MSCLTSRAIVMVDRCVMVSLSAHARRLMEHQFGRDLFSIPALDMLLDLYMQRDGQPRSLTALCAAARAPERSALRIIHKLVKQGLMSLTPDPRDARRINVELSAQGFQTLDTYFDNLLAVMARTEPRNDLA